MKLTYSITKLAESFRETLPPKQLQEQALLKAANITEIIRRTIPLEQEGEYYRGFCWLHPDPKPNLTVRPAVSLYYCFSCHVSGDATSFIMLRDKVDRNTALDRLAKEANRE